MDAQEATIPSKSAEEAEEKMAIVEGEGKNGSTDTTAASPVEEEGDSQHKTVEQTAEGVAEVQQEEEAEGAENKETTTPASQASSSSGEQIDFKIVYNKKKYDVTFGLDDTVGQLKSHLQDVIGVPSAMQKIMIKGLAKDEMSLRKLGVTKGAKVMVVGSTLSDVLEVAKKPTPQQLKEVEEKEVKKESWSQQKQHKKVLEKGVPEDVMPGLKNTRESLPSFPLSGMLNKAGGKVRLTFKLELDQLWLGTKERTEKLPLNSIKNVKSEPIEGHEEYHIVALQLGPTEASRYFIYWVPAQYVESIRDAILGKWQYY